MQRVQRPRRDREETRVLQMRRLGSQRQDARRQDGAPASRGRALGTTSRSKSIPEMTAGERIRNAVGYCLVMGGLLVLAWGLVLAVVTLSCGRQVGRY